MHLIKPSFINKSSIKSPTKLENQKETYDGFTIIINMLREALPHVGNYGAMIEPNSELKSKSPNQLTFLC